MNPERNFMFVKNHIQIIEYALIKLRYPNQFLREGLDFALMIDYLSI